MTTTEQRAATLASRLTRFRESVDAIPDVAARLAQGQQFNAYESALNDEDAADEDCTMYLSIGSIDDRRSIVTVEGRTEADMIAHALTFASLASVSSASAEPTGHIAQRIDMIGKLIERLEELRTIRWNAPDKEGVIHQLVDRQFLIDAIICLDAYRQSLAVFPEPVPATNQAGEVFKMCADIADAFARGQAQMIDEEGPDEACRGGKEVAEFIANAIRRRAGFAQQATSRSQDNLDAAMRYMGGERETVATQPATSQEGEALALRAIKAVTATAKDGAAGLARIMAITNAVGVHAPYSDLLQDPAVALIVERPRTEWAHLFKPDATGCAIPPDGWQCSRARGHTGPCAATPTPPTLSEDLRALSERATQGEWRVAEGSVEDGSIYIDAAENGERPVAMIMSGSPHNQDRADAAFIVAAVEHVRTQVSA